MPKESEGYTYRSIDEVRIAFYPRNRALLGLEKEEVIEVPANLSKSLQVGATADSRAESQKEQEAQDNTA